MIINSGIIEIGALYEFVQNDITNASIKGRSVEGKIYGKEVKRITQNISDEGGFYIWGSYNHKLLWNNIYIGKAGFFKTTGLRSRIREELKDERQFLWKIKMEEDNILKLCEMHYQNMFYKYSKEWRRHFKKFNTTHIIWVAIDNQISERKILTIESDIIETMNPFGNLSRPKPFSELQDSTIEIIRRFKHHIHENRSLKPFIPGEFKLQN